jgi:hexokinase
MCARSTTGEETDIRAVQENEMQSQGFNQVTHTTQEQTEVSSHVATMQEVCTLPETNSTFYRDILAIVTEKQRVMVWAMYDRFGKWQQSKSYK